MKYLGLGKPLILSLVVHLSFAVLFIGGLQTCTQTVQPTAHDEIGIMYASRVKEEDFKRVLRSEPSRENERQRVEALHRKQELERKKLEVARQHQRELKKLEAKREEVLKKQDNLRKEREESEIKKQRIKQERRETLRKQLTKETAKRRATETKKREEVKRRAAEAKKREEAKRRAAEAKKEEEVKRRAVEMKKREEAKRRATEDKKRQEKLLRIRKRELDFKRIEYGKLLGRRISKAWIEPATPRRGECVINLLLSPKGAIRNLQISRCSGDRIYRRSVENAVKKASPFPLPEDKEIFDPEIEINFRPP